jgi:cytochrome c553
MIRWPLAVVSLASSVLAQDAALRLFESEVRPILKACQACHNEKNKSSGLALDSREGFLAGGNRGAALLAGKPAESLIYQAVEQSSALKMPPGGKLKPEQIVSIRKWIESGAPWPAEQKISKRAGSDHWAFRPVKRPAPPAVRNPEWIRNPIDAFILARLEAEKLQPSPQADRALLLRRVSLDLTGLLPTPSETADFVNDAGADAYDRVVTRLLDSPHYGERWGRHWLDIARYADSDGYTIDAPRVMWRYRDWVINAINADMPFDRFTIEQFAGDMLPNATLDQHVATGFHRNTPSNFEGGIDFEQYRVEAVVDRVATTGAAYLGLTLGCARCHDHKYDPVSQKEFYQLFAYLNNVDEITTEAERRDFNRPIIEVPTPEEVERHRAFRSQFKALSSEFIKYINELRAKGVPEPNKDLGFKERMANLRDLRRREPKYTTAMVMRELNEPRASYIHLSGDFTRKGIVVKPGIPAALPQMPANADTRLDFAKWLVAENNPLTPRVTMNRFWQHYFGKGIVETENDFGAVGAKPTHPELLDWLAAEFVARKWSMKAMHRTIVTSATYRQASKNREDAAEVDPYNKLLARQNRLRLDAEIIRDAALSASGLLAADVGGPSVYPPIPEGATTVTQVKREWPTATDSNRFRRGLYTYFQRSAAFPGLLVFDAPDATAACTRRNRSNTPLQALTTLNDLAFVEFSQGLAQRVLREGGASDRERIDYAFRLATQRPAREAEKAKIQEFLASRLDEFKTSPDRATEMLKMPVKEGDDMPVLAAWTSASRLLLNLDSFLTRE